MADGFATWLNGISAQWALALWHGASQGLVLLAAVWSVCKVFRRIPSTVRYWLWWLVCAKFLLGALLTPSIPVRVLPTGAPSPTRLAARLHSIPIVHSRLSAVRAIHGPMASGVAEDRTDMSDRTIRTLAPAAPSAVNPAVVARRALSIISIAFCLWFGGVTVLAAVAILRWMRMASIIRGGRPATDLDPSIVADLNGASARAVVSDEAEGICVAGILRPAIVIPERALASTGELRLAIAHELAHLRRKDLWLDLVPAAVSTTFFFVPFIRVAVRACAQSREEACDAAALQSTACSPAEYASMLLKAARPAQPAGALGVSPAYRQLQTRLVGLATATRPVSRPLRVLSIVLAAAVLVGIAPWRLTAHASRPVRREPTPFNPRYELVDLGPISGDDASHFQINDLGQVIGTSNGRPFLWQDGKAQPLGTLRYHNGRGGALNDSGIYAVTCYSDAGFPHAYYARSGVHLVKGLRGYRFTVARGVSDTGWVVGSAQHSGTDAAGAEVSRAVLCIGGRTRDLGTLGGEHGAAYAVNDAGWIVGKADLPASTTGVHPTHAFLWRPISAGKTPNGSMRDLGTLGGTHSFAYALNDWGNIVGFSLIPGDKTRHACLWHADGPAVDLGAPSGDSVSEAHGINDSGSIVGTSDIAPDADGNRAVLWLEDSGGAHPQPIDLNTTTSTDGRWHLQDAMAINNAGIIVGKGTYLGRPHAFLLRPRRP